MPDIAVRRLDFGYFVRPAEETGTGSPRVEACLGYLVEHPDGVLLFDTGMGARPDVDAHYRPRRIELNAALTAIGFRLDQVSQVTNCHLHFDHCGGNPLIGDRPVFVQAVELSTAMATPDYTLPLLIEGRHYAELAGETEVLAGVFLIPTPGHTDGHQSLVVRRSDGNLIVAGQSHDTATAYSADVLSWRGHRDQHAQPLPLPPQWIARLQDFDPRAVFFAHDHAVWTP
ncbi:MAG: MBL fold metallo-hydrolase [Nocardioidaceae bacterium]